MSLGKKYRMARILKGSENFFILPIDHGLTLGPIGHLQNVERLIRSLPPKTISAIVAHKGLANSIYSQLIHTDISLILHLSGSTNLSPDPSCKMTVGSVKHALKLGADGVSIHLNLGAKSEANMLRDFSQVSEECDRWGMPLLAMIYPRGEKIDNEYDPEVVAHSTRIAWELGADIVKVNYTGDVKSFRKVVSAVDIPVIVAGGPKTESDNSILSMVQDSLRSGGSGVAFGRNIFQHADPCLISQKIAKVLQDSSQQVLQEYPRAA